KYGRVIFKILLNNGFDQEISALRAFQGSNFCLLYDYSLEDRAYIMERVSPADTLFIGTTREERITIMAGIFRELHKPSVPDTVFPTYLEWFQAGRAGVQQRKDCATLLYDLETAGHIILDLCEKYPRRLLLHGDLHHENILKNETGGYTVIDPKGVIGDPVFDLSRFILDEFRDDLTSEPRDAITAFVRALGKEVGIPDRVLLQGMYVETVIWLFLS
ncbi:MAG: aminoglycoside phosphotransferase family protein, partial [Lachnospiraceae bacterium]|nr:aminoglycoside phosphotransferase family protein [Lachnospiraceae bacterium]